MQLNCHYKTYIKVLKIQKFQILLYNNEKKNAAMGSGDWNFCRLRWSTGSGIRNWIEAICGLGNIWKKNNLTWIKKVGKIIHSSFDIGKYAKSSNKREGFCDMKERENLQKKVLASLLKWPV